MSSLTGNQGLPDGTYALLSALAAENRSLRAQVARLDEQVGALQRVHRELVSSPTFRLTAPIRRAQELVRLRHQAQRRANGRAAPGDPTRMLGRAAPEITDQQAVVHPLLARTRQHAAGASLPPPRRLPVREATGARVLVIAHVYYPQLWCELRERIERIPEPYDLVVTLVRGASEGLLGSIRNAFPDALVEILDNRGRDMLPLLHVVDLGLVSPHYDAVLKIHTKMSAHRRDGSSWRTALLDSLCPSQDGISLIIDLLRTDREVAMVAPEGYILGSEFWGDNAALVEAIAYRAKLAYDPQSVWFPAGSMFWTKPEVLLALQDPNLDEDDFEYEVAALDGTTAHALERYIGVVVAANGMDVLSTAEVAGRLVQSKLAVSRR